MLRLLTSIMILMMSACGGDAWGGRASVDRRGGPGPNSGDAKPGIPEVEIDLVFAVEAIRIGTTDVEFAAVKATIDGRTGPYEPGEPLTSEAFLTFSPDQ